LAVLYEFNLQHARDVRSNAWVWVYRGRYRGIADIRYLRGYTRPTPPAVYLVHWTLHQTHPTFGIPDTPDPPHLRYT
jgi:hypothetical protein